MNSLKIIQERPLNLCETKKLLEQVKEKQNVLAFRAEKTFDYLQQICEIDEKKSKELYDQLIALKISRLREAQIQNLINILPRTEDDVKLVLQGYNITLTKEAIEQIVNTVAEFLPKK